MGPQPEGVPRHVDPAVLRSTWAKAAGYGDAFFVWFYARLFAKHPELRDLFGVDMEGQRDKLTRTLDLVVATADNPDKVDRQLRHLGRSHRRFGVKTSMYPAVEEALLATLDHFLHPLGLWDQDTERVWRSIYRYASGVMIAAHNEADAINEQASWPATVVAVHETGAVLVTVTVPSAFPGQPGDRVPAALNGEPGTWLTGTFGADHTLLFPSDDGDPTVALSLARPGDMLLLGAPLDPLDLEARS